MQLNDYQQAALKTAVYPPEIGLAYTALGLAGEAGETANKIKKVLRGDDEGKKKSFGGILTEERRDAIKKELGGVMWYLAATAKEAGLSLEEIAQTNLLQLGQRAIDGTLKGDGDER